MRKLGKKKRISGKKNRWEKSKIGSALIKIQFYTIGGSWHHDTSGYSRQWYALNLCKNKSIPTTYKQCQPVFVIGKVTWDVYMIG